jgi:predicted RNase H-like nuclease (RuvC/YqgF family)
MNDEAFLKHHGYLLDRLLGANATVHTLRNRVRELEQELFRQGDEAAEILVLREELKALDARLKGADEEVEQLQRMLIRRADKPIRGECDEEPR